MYIFVTQCLFIKKLIDYTRYWRTKDCTMHLVKWTVIHENLS